RWIYLGFFTAVAVLALKPLLDALLPSGRILSAPFILGLSMLGVSFALLIVGFYLLVSTTRRLKSVNYMICGYCGYDLSDIREHGKCPECGAFYDAGRLENFWKRYVLFNSPFR